ncbi:hypothetical protein LINPERPRIM_LOCUS31617 [Linum perenne]
MSHVVYTNDHMRESSRKAIYNKFYLGCTLLNTTIIDTTSFHRYNLNPDSLFAGTLSSGKFSTYIDGHIIMVTPLLLAHVFHLPLYGDSISSPDEIYLVDFNPTVALSRWTGETYSNQVTSIVSKLLDNLKVVHFFLTRILLPRSIS